MVRLHLLLPHSSIMNDPVNIYISLEAKNEKKKKKTMFISQFILTIFQK